MGKGSKKPRKKVIIVGAGLSGLIAAYTLEKISTRVDTVILEGRARIGGRMYTKKDPSYGYVDAGSSYIGPTQDRILRVAKELGVETLKIYQKGATVFHSQGLNIPFDGSWPYWNPLCWLDCNNLMREIDTCAQKVPADCPWNTEKVDEWDNKTMMQFLKETCWTRSGLEWGRQFVQSNMAAEPEEVSFLYVLWYVKQAGGVRRLWEVPDASNERKFVGGSQQICEKLAKQINGHIEVNFVVKSIVQLPDGQVLVSSDHGDTFEGDFVIIAVPTHLVGHMTFDPPLPAMKNQLTQRMPMGACIKVQVWFKKPFWRDMGLNGTSCVGHGNNVICNTLDDVILGATKFALVCFITADKARSLVQMEKADREAEIFESIARIFPTPEAREVVAYEETLWMEEGLTGGCFTAVAAPGVISRYWRHMRTPFDRVYFAGTETASKWSGYMDGAVQAGERAAREVAAAIGYIPKKHDHIWRDEPPSKDVPAVDIPFNFFERRATTVPKFIAISSAVIVFVIALLKARCSAKRAALVKNRQGLFALKKSGIFDKFSKLLVSL